MILPSLRVGCVLVVVLAGAAGAADEDKPAATKAVPKAVPLDLSAWTIRDKAPVPWWEEMPSPELEAYYHVLRSARQTPLPAFASADRNDLTYAQLLNEPEKHRGAIVHVEGILKRLLRFEAPPAAGVATLYEGSIFDPLIEGANPVRIVCTDLPDALFEGRELNERVAFDGFFFKRERYRTERGRHDAPLVIGRAPVLLKRTPKSAFAQQQRKQAALATTSLVGAVAPDGILLALVAGNASTAWPVLETPAPGKAETLTAARLDLSPFIIEDNTPIRPANENPSEATAYVHVLVTASRIAPKVLADSANPNVSYGHLLKEPQRYRGEIARIEGNLTRVRRFDPPGLALQEGIRNLYEGWIFDPKVYGAHHPMCIIFSELPPNVQVGEKLRQRVSFAGFSFKKYLYQAADGKYHAVPLLIGRMPVSLEPPAAVTDEPLTQGASMVMLFLALVAGTFFLALGLAIWYRRGDREIRNRIANVNSVQFVDPSDRPVETPPHEPQVREEPGL